MCRNSVVNVIEIEKESISTTVATCLRPYGNQALIPRCFAFGLFPFRNTQWSLKFRAGANRNIVPGPAPPLDGPIVITLHSPRIFVSVKGN